jgi:hypothetical protein
LLVPIIAARCSKGRRRKVSRGLSECPQTIKHPSQSRPRVDRYLACEGRSLWWLRGPREGFGQRTTHII